MARSFQLANDTEHLAVEVLAREHPDQSDYWDGNWLTAMIDVACGPWSGKFRAALRAEEFVHFRDQLHLLQGDREAPPAEYESMEPWLRFSVERSDKQGHVRVSGRAQTEPFFDSHNIFYFVLELDETLIAATLDELGDLIKDFPVVGSPHDKAGVSQDLR